jgi:vacuolar-type H+-ATPase subunit I/STV1
MTMIAEIRRWLSGVLELLLWLVAMLALLQVLFGDNFVEFFGIDLVGNIGSIMAKFGNAGLVGILAAALIAYLIARNRSGSSGGP